MRKGKRWEHGSALLVSMGVAAILLVLVAGLFTFVRAERARASRSVRDLSRLNCAQTGLALARTYFATKQANWGTYLKDPKHYNPIGGAWTTDPFYSGKCTGGCGAADTASLSTSAPYNELLYDLDGDGQNDVFIYIRDNQDEIIPAKNDYTHDNDQNVIVGAVCISQTLVPRFQNGNVDPSQLTAESLLSYNNPGTQVTSQSTGGATSAGNLNGT